MIEELETVVLTNDMLDYGSKPGDIWAVVLMHGNALNKAKLLMHEW